MILCVPSKQINASVSLLDVGICYLIRNEAAKTVCSGYLKYEENSIVFECCTFCIKDSNIKNNKGNFD